MKTYNVVVLAIVFISCGLSLSAAQHVNQEKNIIQRMTKASKPHQFLMSFPRSGNTWMRYMIEYLTRRPTAHKANPNTMNMPIGTLENFKLDFTKSPVWKIHWPSELQGIVKNKNTDRLILLLRNPKECMTRHFGRPPQKKDFTQGEGQRYFLALKIYDEWNPQKRLLIRYEDLIAKPRQVAEQLLKFFQDQPTHLNDFFNHFEFHKKRALIIYSRFQESRSKGTDVLFHSKKIDQKHRKQLDAWMQQLYHVFWKKYLVSYAE